MPACSFGGGTCAEDAWDGSPTGLCLFHAPENNRDGATAGVVWECVGDRLEKDLLDFTGWHFPSGGKVFAGRTFASPLQLSGAVFQDEISFMNSTFSAPADFRHSYYRGGAKFGHAVFAQNADFSGAKFTRDVLFGGTLFHGHANFQNASFVDVGGFGGATFEDEADFTKASFRLKAIFEGTRFGRNAIFKGASFRNDANFVHAHFKRCVDFESAVFRGRPMFDGLVLAQGRTAVLGLDNQLQKLVP